MTGNTPTVLIGLAIIALVLPLGFLVLSRAYSTIERAHPERPLDAEKAGGGQASTAIPTPRPAHERAGAATAPR